MEIRYSKAAAKALKHMDKALKARIHAGILGLTETPPKGDIKTMQGFSDGRYRLRVGQYRIIYKYGQKLELEILFIMDIGPRGDIYK
jgi:mRNA interferase RelE/StbE